MQSEQAIEQKPVGAKETAKRKSPKWVILVAILVIVLCAVGAAVYLFTTSGGGRPLEGGDRGDGKNGNKKVELELFNDTNVDDNTLSFTLRDEWEKDDVMNIFVGIKMDGISKNLKSYPFKPLQNDLIKVRSYEPSEFEFELVEASDRYKYWATRISRLDVNDEIIYRVGNYCVTDTGGGHYPIYYVYDEKDEDSAEAGREKGKLNLKQRVLSFGSASDRNEAISRAKDFASTHYICPYSDDEGISKCKDRKSYNYLNDIIVKELGEHEIYVWSYKGLYRIETNGKVSFKDETGRIEFDLTVNNGSKDLIEKGECTNVFDMDGKQYYYCGYSDYFGYGSIYRMDGDDLIVYTAHLPREMEASADNVIRVFKDFFGEKW